MLLFYARTKHQILRIFYVCPGVTTLTRWQQLHLLCITLTYAAFSLAMLLQQQRQCSLLGSLTAAVVASAASTVPTAIVRAGFKRTRHWRERLERKAHKAAAFAPRHWACTCTCG